ncbi:hypothetical protein TWF281_001392 [Arthrobotrys megalospora]
MEAPTFWPQGYSHFDAHSRTRTIDIGEHKLSLPLQPSSQHPIDRFNTGESALPMGLMPDPVHTYQGLNAAAMPGLTFSPMDGDAGSWHSSIRDDDQRSSSTDSSGSGHGIPATWSQGSPVMSSYRSNSIPTMTYQDTAVSPCESTYAFKSSEVIDPNLTLNYQDSEMYGFKPEPTIKFEFGFPNDDAEYEEQYSPEPLSATQYYQQPLSNFYPSALIREVPVTRSQAQNDSRAQGSSRGSSNGTSKSSRPLSKTPLSPISRRRIERRRSSSSSDDQPSKPSNRPKTYKKKVPFHYCEEETCKSERVFFKNRSELNTRKHIETQHTKPYLCIFGFAGCQQRFGARNEWKRHIATQHLVLYKYVCDHSDCVEKNKAKTIFNRGDLFMKHHERMHSPANIYERSPDDLELIAWKKEMKEAKRRCETLRTPPQRMTCGFCSIVFEDGDKTWMELIDHVCLHYQSNDESVKNSNGYKDDPDLIEWMKQHKLIKQGSDSMDIDSETPPSRGSRKHSYASSSESSSARQIKQEQADAF